MSGPNPRQSKPLTAKQQEVVDYLRSRLGEYIPQRDLADALGTTYRGVGVRLSALVWNDDVRVYSQRTTDGHDAEWTIR